MSRRPSHYLKTGFMRENESCMEEQVIDDIPSLKYLKPPRTYSFREFQLSTGVKELKSKTRVEIWKES
jgi:hypothetical protein